MSLIYKNFLEKLNYIKKFKLYDKKNVIFLTSYKRIIYLIKKITLRFFNILFQFGIEPLKILNSTCAIPSYVFNFFKLKKTFNGKFDFYPCLSDKYQKAGLFDSEYFWQDLFVSKLIYQNSLIVILTLVRD